jgi:hypothetical protein
MRSPQDSTRSTRVLRDSHRHVISPQTWRPATASVHDGVHDGAEEAADGGAREDRTPDLLRARQALSQLSYGPWSRLKWDAGRETSRHTSIGGSGWS